MSSDTGDVTSRGLTDVDEFRITDDEVEEFRQIFTINDADSDGQIPLNEMASLLKGIGVNVTEDEILQTAASNVDAGSMNFNEFLQFLMDKRRLADPEANIRDAFRLFDKDADGYLTLRDLKQVMLNLGEKLTDEEVTEMIRAADADDEDKVNYAEFARMMASV